MKRELTENMGMGSDYKKIIYDFTDNMILSPSKEDLEKYKEDGESTSLDEYYDDYLWGNFVDNAELTYGKVSILNILYNNTIASSTNKSDTNKLLLFCKVCSSKRFVSEQQEGESLCRFGVADITRNLWLELAPIIILLRRLYDVNSNYSAVIILGEAELSLIKTLSNKRTATDYLLENCWTIIEILKPEFEGNFPYPENESDEVVVKDAFSVLSRKGATKLNSIGENSKPFINVLNFIMGLAKECKSEIRKKSISQQLLSQIQTL